MRTRRRTRIARIVLCSVLGATGCGKTADGSADSAVAKDAAASSTKISQRTGADRNACDLLTEAEIGAAVGAVVKAKEIHREQFRPLAMKALSRL
jgi:hypothetical protein